MLSICYKLSSHLQNIRKKHFKIRAHWGWHPFKCKICMFHIYCTCTVVQGKFYTQLLATPGILMVTRHRRSCVEFST